MIYGKQTYGLFWILIILLGLESGHGLRAQDPAFFSQHLQNPLVYNPAFAGHREIPGLSIQSRQQWMGWEGSPSASSILLHTKLKNKNAGAGISLFYDGMGPVHKAGFAGAYSYSLQVSENKRLVFGLQGEMSFRQIELSRLKLVDQGDLLFAEDPGIRLQPNVGVGVLFMAGKYAVHLSVPRLLNSKLSPYGEESSKWSTTTRVFYVGAFRSFELNEDLSLLPSILLALSRGNSPFLEFSGILSYQKHFEVGLLYRINQTVGALVRYHHQQKFIFGYSYDVSLNMAHYNAGTHELFLGYNFPFNQSKTLSPRRF